MPILPEVAAMRGVQQPPEFHPEGDVWTHTLIMLDGLRDPTITLALGVLLGSAQAEAENGASLRAANVCDTTPVGGSTTAPSTGTAPAVVPEAPAPARPRRLPTCAFRS